MELINVLFVICGVIFILYKYGTRKYGYWKSKGVPQLNPVPFAGDHYPLLLKLVDGLEVFQRFYTPFKETRFGGIYLFQIPFLVITDPELLKQVMVKDSDHFVNRYDWTDSSDPLFSRNLVTLKDDKWRRMRAVMTTVFTSSKMKDMFRFMDKCAEQSVQHLEAKIEEKKKMNPSGRAVIEVDLKDFFSRYGTDVIGSTAFGLEVDSFKNPENEFYKSGEVARQFFQGKNQWKFILLLVFPKLAKVLNVSFFGKKTNKFFNDVVSETIQEREKKNIVRKDVIHVLMEARKGKGVNENGNADNVKLPDLTDEDITAQAIIFFFAGFETIASLLGFVSYELAINPDVQEKLQAEIDEVIEKENGVTYDGVIHQMQYLNMVINETLRKWPPAAISDRVASRTYVIPKTDKSPEITLTKDDKILIPIAGFHYDPQYFPNPQKFDPDRFINEKATIKPFTYLPFGEGPRHCIGMRYALMEAKSILVHLLKKFTIVPTEKTQIPIKLSKTSAFTLLPEKGFTLGLQLRN